MRLALLAIVVAGVPPAARAADDEPSPPAAVHPVGAPADGASADAPPAAAPPPVATAVPAGRGQPTLESQPPKRFPKLRQASLLHKYQLGIALLPGAGFRGIAPYE